MIIHFQDTAIHFKNPEEPPLLSSPQPLPDDIETCFQALKSGSGNFQAPIHHDTLRRLLLYVRSNFIVVKAAGGIVSNPLGERLLILRNGRYDLPKGKVEAGETLAQAALRETQEETGIGSLSLGPLLLKTYHIYNLYGGWHFKQTSWFLMSHAGHSTLRPQAEEGITQALWADNTTWLNNLMSSYSTMRQIASAVAAHDKPV